ncbi:MAG: serine hydrolase [Geminicoccaceae bacterium]
MIPRLLIGAVILLGAIDSARAEVRCGVSRPIKQEVERSTANIDTAKFLNHVRDSFRERFKGYAVILTGSQGRRLGFRREGWAIDPCEPSTSGVRFDLNTESAIGSVTKLFTTVAVLKATTDSPASHLQRPLTHFLPFRWRNMAHSFYDTVTIEELLQHKGGFFKSGGGKHVSERLAGGRERSLGDYRRQPRFYSNSSMGIFHFIYARYGFRSTNFLNPKSLHDVEVEHQNSNNATYNAEVQKVTSAAFNHGLYRHILKPLAISATCDARVSRFPASNAIKSPPNAPIVHFPFHNVARSYASATDSRGALLASSMQNCAAGGLYMSAKDLAAFVFALGDLSFLSKADRDRMMNGGPVNNLYAFGTISAEGGRAFWHNGKRTEGGNSSYAVVLRFASGASAVFVTNSDNDGTNTLNTIRDAYNLARQ